MNNALLVLSLVCMPSCGHNKYPSRAARPFRHYDKCAPQHTFAREHIFISRPPRTRETACEISITLAYILTATPPPPPLRNCRLSFTTHPRPRTKQDTCSPSKVRDEPRSGGLLLPFPADPAQVEHALEHLVLEIFIPASRSTARYCGAFRQRRRRRWKAFFPAAAEQGHEGGDGARFVQSLLIHFDA